MTFAQKLYSAGLTAIFGTVAIIASASTALAQVADGDIDADEYLTSNQTYVLSRGDRGVAVEDVQIYLRDEGYYLGPIDGIYGPITEQAVLRYQVENELPATGVVRTATFEEMADSADFDDGLFDEDGVFDNEGVFDGEDGDGIFDNEGQFDGEDDGLL